MDNLNLLRQTIRFQRTALQNSLTMIAALQQHGEKLLKTTLEQSPWIPGEGRDAWLFWAGLWAKNLTRMTDLVDKNLATMERFTSTGGNREAGKAKPPEKPAAEPNKPPPLAVQKATLAPKQEAMPEPKQEATPKPKQEATPEPKQETTPAPKLETTPGPKQEATPAPKLEATPGPKQEATPEKKEAEKKLSALMPRTAEKLIPPHKLKELTALARTEAHKAPVTEKPPEKKPEQPHGKKPHEKKKTSEPKS